MTCPRRNKVTHIVIPRLQRNRAGVEAAFVLNRKIKLSPKLLAIVVASEFFKDAHKHEVECKHLATNE